MRVDANECKFGAPGNDPARLSGPNIDFGTARRSKVDTICGEGERRDGSCDVFIGQSGCF